MGIETNVFSAESILLSTIKHRRTFHYTQRNENESNQLWYKRLEHLTKPCLFGGTFKAFLLNKFVIDLCGNIDDKKHPINGHRRKFHYAQRNANESIQEWIIRLKSLAGPCYFQEHLEAFLFNKLVVDLGNAVLTTTSGLKLNSLLEKMCRLDGIEMEVDIDEQSVVVESAQEGNNLIHEKNDEVPMNGNTQLENDESGRKEGNMSNGSHIMQPKTYFCESCPERKFKFKCKQKHVHFYSNIISFLICYLFPYSTVRLLEHMQQYHYKTKSYCCSMCGKTFRVVLQLNKHMRTHTGERPFECELCLKRFARADKLSQHKRIHFGIKAYTCKICQKSYTQAHSLTMHLRTHVKIRPPINVPSAAVEIQ